MEDISDTDGENETVTTSTNERTPLLPDQPRNQRRPRRSARRTRRRAPTVDSVGSSSLAPSSSSQADPQQPQTSTSSAMESTAASIVAAVRNVFTSNTESRQRVVEIDVNQSLPSPSGQYSVNCDDDGQVSTDETGQSPDNGTTASTSAVVQVEMNHPTVEESVEPRQQRRSHRRRTDNIV